MNKIVTTVDVPVDICVCVSIFYAYLYPITCFRWIERNEMNIYIISTIQKVSSAALHNSIYSEKLENLILYVGYAIDLWVSYDQKYVRILRLFTRTQKIYIPKTVKTYNSLERLLSEKINLVSVKYIAPVDIRWPNGIHR